MPPIRDDLEALKIEVERLRSSDAGWQTGDFLGITKSVDSYPTVADAFYAVSPVKIDGAETEGTDLGFTVNSAKTLYAVNVGNSVPPVGTLVLVKSVPSRYVFEYSI